MLYSRAWGGWRGGEGRNIDGKEGKNEGGDREMYGKKEKEGKEGEVEGGEAEGRVEAGRKEGKRERGQIREDKVWVLWRDGMEQKLLEG